MTKKVSFKTRTRSGDDVNVYGQLTEDGRDVLTWTKFANYGIFHIERFGSKGLTSATLKHVMTVGDVSE